MKLLLYFFIYFFVVVEDNDTTLSRKEQQMSETLDKNIIHTQITDYTCFLSSACSLNTNELTGQCGLCLWANFFFFFLKFIRKIWINQIMQKGWLKIWDTSSYQICRSHSCPSILLIYTRVMFFVPVLLVLQHISHEDNLKYVEHFGSGRQAMKALKSVLYSFINWIPWHLNTSLYSV